MLIAFSVGGMSFHDTQGPWLLEFFRIGWPFFVGYGLSALLLGAWRVPDFGRNYFRSGTLAWLVGISLGMLLRIVATGRVPITSFIFVTLGFTGVLLLGWRAIYRIWGSRGDATGVYR